MNIKTETGLVFHDVVYRRGGGVIMAFVTCKDKTSHTKYYWGLCDSEDNPEQIKQIMEKGGKWRGMNDDGDILL